MTDVNISNLMLKKQTIQVPSFERNYNIFHNYFTHTNYSYFNSVCFYNILLTCFILFQHIPCIYVHNLSNMIMILLVITYYNISSDLGKNMSVFIIFTHGLSMVLSVIVPNINMISAVVNLLSTSFITIGYNSIVKKEHSKILNLKYRILFMAPLYSYIYLESSYKITHLFNKAIGYACNYIKRFSTSDIIKYAKGRNSITLPDIVRDESNGSAEQRVAEEVFLNEYTSDGVLREDVIDNGVLSEVSTSRVAGRAAVAAAVSLTEALHDGISREDSVSRVSESAVEETLTEGGLPEVSREIVAAVHDSDENVLSEEAVDEGVDEGVLRECAVNENVLSDGDVNEGVLSETAAAELACDKLLNTPAVTRSQYNKIT